MTTDQVTQPDTDILTPGNGTVADDQAMAACPSYDYRAQTWRDSSDHAHFTSDDSPLLFCGADGPTCVGDEAWNEWVAR